MIAATLLFGLLVIAAIAFLMLMQSASRRPDEFDGGYNHDNETRITRVRGTYIINDGEQM